MTSEEILSVISIALDNLYDVDNEIINPEYNLHERTIASLLARYIWAEIEDEDISVDVEYNRMRMDYNTDSEEVINNYIAKRLNLEAYGHRISNVMPDIIIHKRNQNINLAVVEIKMAWKNSEKQFDLIKINEYMKQLEYDTGFYIELNESRESVIIDSGPFDL